MSGVRMINGGGLGTQKRLQKGFRTILMALATRSAESTMAKTIRMAQGFSRDARVGAVAGVAGSAILGNRKFGTKKRWRMWSGGEAGR